MISYAKNSVSFSGTTLTAATAILASGAPTAVTQQTYSGAALNGSMGGTITPCSRRVTATLSAHAGSYINSSTITINGTDENGKVIADTLTIVGTGGGTTLTSTKFFATVTSIVVAAQTDALGAFTFGVSDALVQARQLRVGTAGNVHVQYQDGSADTLPKVQAGEQIPGAIAILFADSTAQDISAYR